MKELTSDVVILDRLSELPDSLIHQIFSLLNTRDVVRTTLLSTRWRDFWVTTPFLKFTGFGRDLVKIRNFVYRTLTLWRGTHLKKFSNFFISDSDSGASLAMDIALWVQFATERKVEDLCIEFHCTGQLWRPPQCLYECSSIRKLSLHSCNLQIRRNVKWDRLNTLELTDCVFYEYVLNKVLSSTPLLETFTVSCVKFTLQDLSIRSSSLKKLWIGYYDINPSVLTIWAPNLQVLKYSGTPHVKCLLTDISSLIDVHLDFSSGQLKAVKEALRQILPVIQHVKTVRLSVSCFKVLRDIRGNDSCSPLLNVELLTIDSWSIELTNIDYIFGLLEWFPKLKMLIINWKFVGEEFKFDDAENVTKSEANILKSNLLQLRTVVITTRYVYKASYSEFTVFLLKHATMIEKMVIRREGEVNSEEMFEAAKKLMSLQRSFPSVELILC